MLSQKNIYRILDNLNHLQLNYRYGYAGSYARGNAKENSDLDIIVKGKERLSSEYTKAVVGEIRSTAFGLLAIILK